MLKSTKKNSQDFLILSDVTNLVQIKVDEYKQ